MRQLALCIALLAPLAAFAQAVDPAAEGAKKLEADNARSYLRMAFNFYDQTDGGGNPDVNEKMRVMEPQVLVGIGVSEKLSLSLKIQAGVVSAASNSGGSRGKASSKKRSTSTRGREDLTGPGGSAARSKGQTAYEVEGGDDDGGGPVSGASGGPGGGPVTGASGGGGGGGPVSGASGSGTGSPRAVSGASGGGGGEDGDGSLSRYEPFVSIEPGLFYAWSDEVGTGVGLSYTWERTYRSIGVNARGVYTTPDKNNTLSVRGSAAFDTLEVRTFDGTGSGNANRNSYSLGLGWTHILTPTTQMALNYDLTYQRGELATTTNSVLVAGTEVREVLPATRLRHAWFGRIRQKILEDVAVEPGAGFYLDDWGAKAASFELHGFWEFVPGVLILQPSYRFHWQSEVDWFTGKSETSVPAYRTQDSDLGTFTSHTVGLKLVAPKVMIFGADTEFELGGDYTFRSDRLNSFTLTAGFLVRF